jgi:hypothetical protein
VGGAVGIGSGGVAGAGLVAAGAAAVAVTSVATVAAGVAVAAAVAVTVVVAVTVAAADSPAFVRENKSAPITNAEPSNATPAITTYAPPLPRGGTGRGDRIAPGGGGAGVIGRIGSGVSTAGGCIGSVDASIAAIGWTCRGCGCGAWGAAHGAGGA